jgi:hypothetical protein
MLPFHSGQRRLTWPDPSELASDDSVMAKLWRDSAALVRLVYRNDGRP